MNRLLLLLVVVFSFSLVASVSYSFDRGEVKSVVIEGVHYDISFVESDGLRSRFAVNNELTQSLRVGEYGFAGGLFVQAGQMSSSGLESSGGMVEFCIAARSERFCDLRNVLFEQESLTLFIEGSGEVRVTLLSVSERGARFSINGQTTNFISWDPDKTTPVTVVVSNLTLSVYDILRLSTQSTARAAFFPPDPVPRFSNVRGTSLGSNQAPQVLAYIDMNEHDSRHWIQRYMREVLASDFQFTVKPVARDLGLDTHVILSLLCSTEQNKFFPFLYALSDQPRDIDSDTRLLVAKYRSGVSEAELTACVRADTPGSDIQENLQEWMSINYFGPVPLFVVGDEVLTGLVSVQDISRALTVEVGIPQAFRFGIVDYSSLSPSIVAHLESLFGTTPQRVLPEVFDSSSFENSAVFIIRDDVVLAMIGHVAVAEYVPIVMSSVQLFEEAGFQVQIVTTKDAIGKSVDELFEEEMFSAAPVLPELDSVRVRITRPLSQDVVSQTFDVVISTRGDVSRTEFFVEGFDGGMLSSLSPTAARSASFDVSSFHGDRILVVARAYDSTGRFVEDRVIVRRAVPEQEVPLAPSPVAPIEPAPPTQPTSPTHPVVCDGCSVDGRCISVGVRFQHEGRGIYCSLSGELVDQQPMGVSCENNFECQTNQCSSGVCVDLVAEIEEARGMFERIATWFGRLFGR